MDMLFLCVMVRIFTNCHIVFHPDIPDTSLAAGILPVEIRKLVQSRKQVKGLMKEKGITKEQYMQVPLL